jgi:hypothetical protein
MGVVKVNVLISSDVDNWILAPVEANQRLKLLCVASFLSAQF